MSHVIPPPHTTTPGSISPLIAIPSIKGFPYTPMREKSKHQCFDTEFFHIDGEKSGKKDQTKRKWSSVHIHFLVWHQDFHKRGTFSCFFTAAAAQKLWVMSHPCSVWLISHCLLAINALKTQVLWFGGKICRQQKKK